MNILEKIIYMFETANDNDNSVCSQSILFAKCTLPILIWARDNAGLKIGNENLFQPLEHFTLGSLINFLTEERFAALPEELEKPLLTYVVSLGFAKWENSIRAERVALTQLYNFADLMLLMDKAYEKHGLIVTTCKGFVLQKHGL